MEIKSGIEQLKEGLIGDYSKWVENALYPLDDNIGIFTTSVENFKLKLDKLIEYVNQSKSHNLP